MMTAGVTAAGTGLGDITWNILGQTYRPLALSSAGFAFHVLAPAGSFLRPHIHPAQDEFIHIIQGTFDVWLDGATVTATTGDTIRLPMSQPHGIFNRSGADATALVWVAPSLRLYELFTQLHDLVDPTEAARLAAAYDLHFLPP